MSDVMVLDSNENSAKPWLKPQLETLEFKMYVRSQPADVSWSSPVYGRVGVELKSLDDLCNSVNTANQNMIPRLDDELRRLQESYGLAILLAHDYAKWEFLFSRGKTQGRWTPEAVDNILFGRQLYGIVVARARATTGSHGVAVRLASLHHYTQTPGTANKLLPPHRFTYMGPMTDRAEVIFTLLSRLRGMKNKRDIAEKLADLGSLREVTSWEAPKFRELGMTKLMAERLDKLLKEEI